MYAKMLRMPDDRSNPNAPVMPRLVITPIVSALHRNDRKADDIAVCERCGAEMYRMHAVWRCPACRFKTDCCGW
jgi:rubrerythrin